MSIFKKITSFLFEEQEDEIVEDDEIQPLTMKNSEVELEQEERLKKEEQVVVEKVVEQPQEPVSKFVDITDNDPIEEKKEVVKEVKPQEPVKKEVKKEYEFTPVISPMFGVSEEEIKASKKASVKPVSTHHMTKKNNPLGTILSPFYGLSEESPFEQASKPVKKEEEKKEVIKKEEVVEKEVYIEPSVAEVKEDVQDSFEPEIPFEKPKAQPQEVVPVKECVQTKEEMLKQEEASSIPLEDLIADDSNKNEDLMQISLFGESTPIKECNTDNILNE